MSLAQGNNTPTLPRIELSKVYMLKTCLEIITEKERGMKLFSWIHMFLTLFPSHVQASALFEKWLKKVHIDFVSTSLLLMPGITGLHHIVSDMDKNRLYHL